MFSCTLRVILKLGTYGSPENPPSKNRNQNEFASGSVTDEAATDREDFVDLVARSPA